MRKLEKLICEERLKEVGLISLKKEGIREYHPRLPVSKSSCKDQGTFFTRMHSDGTRGVGNRKL